jgi:hypothetical protein
MSWLRQHFYEFVFPSFFNTLEYDEASQSISGPHWPKVPEKFPRKFRTYFNGKIAAPGEIRALYYLMEECYASPGRIQAITCNSSNWPRYYNLIKRSLLAAESRRKKLGCSKILLTGRDVWVMEVLARRLGIETIFLPQISRNSVVDVSAYSHRSIRDFFKENGVTGDELLIDTGFAGSIPRSIEKIMVNGKRISCLLISQANCSLNDDYPYIKPLNERVVVPEKKGRKYFADGPWNPNRRPNQIFPNMQKVRQKVLKIEDFPQYWASGRILRRGFSYEDSEYEVYQNLSTRSEFVACAVLTSLFWRGMKGVEDLPALKKKAA